MEGEEGGRVEVEVEVTGGTYCFRFEEQSQRGAIFDEVTRSHKGHCRYCY